MSERQTEPVRRRAGFDGRSALGFVLIFGVISLLADATYEGARSITGPYLAFLGASAAVAGIVAGAGEFVGYALRLVSGYFTDRTGRFWAVTIWGYAITFVAVPLLALAGSWEIAAFLIIAERLGKAIRTPARDAMLSHATAGMGRGWGFGLHEALDQVGAVIGPLLVAAVLYFGGGYSGGFGILLIPAALALAVLLLARHRYQTPGAAGGLLALFALRLRECRGLSSLPGRSSGRARLRPGRGAGPGLRAPSSAGRGRPARVG